MNFRIGIALPAQVPVDGPLDRLFPRLTQAVEAVARDAQMRWIGFASGAPLPDGRSIQPRSGAYARSIELEQNGALSWRVKTELPYAKTIEQGQPAMDMKKWLRTSMKVRVAKDGTRYLIIPFRHGTPGSSGFPSTMPPHVHEVAKQLKASRVTGSAKMPNAIGFHDIKSRSPVMVDRRTYSWGDKLPGDMAGKRKESHKADPFKGMVRFDAPQKGHSTYMTFRVMSEKSAGWIRGAVPGFWPARTVAGELLPKAEGLFREALGEDIKALMQGAS